MKILQVNKFNYPKGGADKYFLDLSTALEQVGHQVAVFSMADKNNLPSAWSNYFVSNFDFNNLNFLKKLLAPERIIYSLEAKRKFEKLIEDFRPDIIHIHNIYHQISPSILDVARRYKIPVIMHLHDYKLICPNYQLFTGGRPCEACRPDKYYQCIKKRCFKNSLSQSLLAALEMYIHHKILKIYKKNVTVFIAPSNFMKNKVMEFNWPGDKIAVITNPYSGILEDANDKNILSYAAEENYLLYFGRLSPEKDVKTLIEIAIKNNWPLKIVGQGPEEAMLKKVTTNNPPIEFTGFKSGTDLQNIILKARAIIIPSISYDNMPLSLLEALRLGKIVIASRIGGLPEIIEDGVNGLLFTPGDEAELTAKIRSLENLDKPAMKLAARVSVESFSLKNNLNALEKIYEEAVKL